MKDQPKIAYLGGEPLGAPTLEVLCECGLSPALVVCSPDRPSGRGLTVTPPPVKTVASSKGISVLQPENLKDQTALAPLLTEDWDLFVVVAYNHILPKWLIEHPKHGTINLHPSLLPKLRGPSPIRTAILEDNRDAVGVSVMLMDEEMDHGPLLATEQVIVPTDEWPLSGTVLDKLLTEEGARLLADTIPLWLAGSLVPQEQDHERATYTKKLTRADGELLLDPFSPPSGTAAYELLCKIRAFAGWPSTYFFADVKRIKITEVELADDGSLKLLRVIPEGKKEMDFAAYRDSLGA